MERLWAPWRMKYIVGDKASNGCVFCNTSQQADDAKNHVLLRDRTCFAILNIYPYSNGHLMVAPYKHTGDFESMTEQELGDLMVLTRRCQLVLKAAFNPEGFNVGVNIGKAAGAGMPDHLHIHIVPRWSGDCNFMTAINDMRIIPDSLDATYAKLKEALATQ